MIVTAKGVGITREEIDQLRLLVAHLRTQGLVSIDQRMTLQRIIDRWDATEMIP